MRVLFICTGNICRSAMAHCYMQKRIKDLKIEKDIEVDSAGTNTYTGDRATEFAIEVMKAYDTNLENHRATSIEDCDVKSADIILCMAYSHKVRVLNRYPEVADRIYTIKEFIGEEGYIDIDDPWGLGKNVYESCAREIVYCVDKVIEKIQRGEKH